MTVRLVVRSPQVVQAELDRLNKRLMIAADMLKQHCQRLVSKPARRITRRVAAGRTGPEGQRRSWTEYVGSRPGQPPMLRTGFGRSSITFWAGPRKLTARVGMRRNAIYMAYLELGTRRIARRPWLSRAVREMQSRLARILTSR